MRNLKDANGKSLPREEVEELAIGNIMASMSLKELAIEKVDKLNRASLLQWATDADGNFPNWKNKPE